MNITMYRDTLEWTQVSRSSGRRKPIVISHLSMHMFTCANFLTNMRVHILLFEHVIFREYMIFLHLTFNVTLLTFRWNVSNDRRNSSYICSTSVWTSEQSNWSLMSRIMLCRALEPLKLVALSDSTNVSISWISSSICWISRWHLRWLHTPAPVPACSAHLACSTL